MRISIHQPQFLPWVNYFLKIDAADKFVFLDDVQFQKNGLQNRNKIKTASGEMWLSLPVKSEINKKISEVEIHNNNWQNKMLRTLQQNYSKSLYFNDFFPELSKLILNNSENLCILNIKTTKLMLKWMGIETPTINSSKFKVRQEKTERLVDICKSTGGSEYLSGTGGKVYLNETLFKEAGIDLKFFNNAEILPYPQCFPKTDFTPNISAIDLLFNVGFDWRSYICYPND